MLAKGGKLSGGSSGNSTFSIRNISITLVAGLLIYWLYTKLFKPKSLNIQYNEQVLSTSTEIMSNGTSYYQFARNIANEFFSPWLWGLFSGFQFKDSDEAMIGGLMLTVKSHEFTRLSDTYIAYKATSKMGGGSLESDIRRAFNAKELKQYMSHLITI